MGAPKIVISSLISVRAAASSACHALRHAEAPDRFHEGSQHDGIDGDQHQFLEYSGREDRYEAVSVEHGEPDAGEEQAADQGVNDLGSEDPEQGRAAAVENAAEDHAREHGCDREAGKEGAGRFDQIAAHVRDNAHQTADNGPEEPACCRDGQDHEADLDDLGQRDLKEAEHDGNGGQQSGAGQDPDVPQGGEDVSGIF